MVTRIRRRPSRPARGDHDIERDNLNAVAAIYAAYQLEALRVFQVVDRLVDLFGQGQLPLGRGRAGERMRRYIRQAPERMTAIERRDLYAWVLGAPGGTSSVEPNREFDTLWLRFVSAVSAFARQLTADPVLATADTAAVAVAREQVHKSGRDLAANLSLAGRGITRSAAVELQQTLIDCRDLLQDTELRGAFGARDLWQVIDQVNLTHLGGARNSRRHRTLGEAGAVIIRWLAEHADGLGDADTPLLSAETILAPRAGGDGEPMKKPDDRDLVDACEQWLAAVASGED